MKNKTLKIIITAIFILLALAFVAKLAGPRILKMYIETGIGDCRKIPILCMRPTEKINTTVVNKKYVDELLTYDFPKIIISVPKGFAVVNQLIKKPYYKKWKRKNNDSVVYILRQEPSFFPDLYPQIKKLGLKDNYEFIRRTMFTSENDIKNLADAFFVIMKSILIPDLGDQTKAKMENFAVGDMKGFINYNITGADRYFNCDAFDSKGNFFAIYIKDKGATLNLDKVLAIVSTVKAR